MLLHAGYLIFLVQLSLQSCVRVAIYLLRTLLLFICIIKYVILIINYYKCLYRKLSTKYGLEEEGYSWQLDCSN